MKCIYCSKTDKEITFNKSEHIIPQSFGKFEDNLTLIGIVCDECNQYFGDLLEIHLARDTREGDCRFDFGVKDDTDYKNVRAKSRKVIKIAEGSFKGAYAYKNYDKRAGKITLFPCPQVGFIKTNGAYDFYLMSDIPGKEILDNKYNLDDPKGILFLPDTNQKALEVLRSKGIEVKIKHYGDTHNSMPEKINCDVKFTVDYIIFRAIAKIAFNYLIKMTNSNFCSHEDFEVIKKFIAHGTNTPYSLVIPTNIPILGDEYQYGQRRLGHMVTINWANDEASIIGKVSFFNDITYHVCLVSEFSGDHIDLENGHFFNLADRKIYEMYKGPRIIN